MSDEEPNRKNPLSLGVVSVFVGMTAMTLSGSQDRGENESIRDRFVGAWRLAWLEYEIDERAHSFTYHVEGALVRTLIGKDLARVFDFLANSSS